jgi:hypothetical protein
MGGEIGEGGQKETREFFARNFFRRHSKVVVTGPTEPAHIAFNCHVVTRISKN